MRQEATGFTLLELMTTLAVLAVLVTMGAPTFGTLTRRMAAAAAFHQLTTSLATARITAVSRGVPVTVCPSRDGHTCREDLDWSDGWLVYADPSRAVQPANAGAVLQVVDFVPKHVAIRASSGRHRVRYQATGMSGGNNVTLRLCTRHKPHMLGAVIVNNAGRPRTDRTETSIPCPFATTGA